jgi:hypothetical protein
MQQTGKIEFERRAHLQRWHDGARAALLHQWEPEQVAEAVF